ncbi:hypothetical protein FSP39_003085 [Pinctada imbricata]|uniref:Deltamethrin resistance protein prag01 domain-containing protein n=1 Tax=Pinctada imbricata TaxID=66713 RepID=A0AA88YCA9_PINIB|nr:hypothetical protein FSP39_003085 [Pinctada imbricata]
MLQQRHGGGSSVTLKDIDAEDKMIGNHLDSAPVPSGDWSENYKKRQLKLNFQLVAAIIFFAGSVYYAKIMGSLDVGFPYEIPIPEHLVPEEAKRKKSITDTYAFQAALIEAYICIELHRISATKYKYYLGTKITSTNNDYMYGALSGTSIDMATACNRATPYDQATFITLFKEGTLDTGESVASCPHELLNNYGSVTIYNADSSVSCGENTVKGCEDRTQLRYTYQSCSTGLAFSSGGLFFCLHNEVVDGTTYVILYNNDTTVNGASTYRHTCMALVQSSAQISVTEMPLFCSDESMTSSTVSSPGIKYAMTSKTEDCCKLLFIHLSNYINYTNVEIIFQVLSEKNQKTNKQRKHLKCLQCT